MNHAQLNSNFKYDHKWDSCNVVRYQLLKPRDETIRNKEMSELQVQMIERSQPRSIYNKDRNTFIANSAFMKN